WTALFERQGGLEFSWAAKCETDTFGHEPTLVARTCSPAKLLGFPKFVGTPRCSDARRCHPCAWQSGLAGRNGLASNKQTTRRVAICTHRQQRGTGPHSITSSARASSMGGTARPSIRAVSALLTRSNLLDCTTGRSAGLGPLQDAAGIDTELAKRIHDVGSITHQPANFDKVARRIDRREPVERRQLDHLDTPGIQESVGPDEQGIGPIAPDILEGGIDLAAGASVENLDLYSHGPSGPFHL